METLGSAVDKLMTVNFKTYYNLNPDQKYKLFNLRLQRGAMAAEIDTLADKVLNGRVDATDAMRPQHKTY